MRSALAVSVNGPAGAANSSLPSISLRLFFTWARWRGSCSANHPAMRSNLGHQNARTPGSARSPVPNARSPTSSSAARMSSGSATGQARRKSSIAL